jgi:hypothetical protein
LIEMLVVIAILALLVTITITAVNFSFDTERIRGGSRQVQAVLEGGRDRAIHAGQPRGVRFLPDQHSRDRQNNTAYFVGNVVASVPFNGFAYTCSVAGNSAAAAPMWPLGPSALGSTVVDGAVTWVASSATSSSCVYIGAPEQLTGSVIVQPPVGALPNLLAPPQTLAPPLDDWTVLRNRGLLPDGARIEIGNNHYSITLLGGAWSLTKNFTTALVLPSSQPYQLDIQPSVLPGQEPQLFPRAIHIDLASSQIPGSWRVRQMDILFSPRGRTTGYAAAGGTVRLGTANNTTGGMVNFLLADQVDLQAGLSPGDPAKQGGERAVSLAPLTGNISAHQVYIPADWLPSAAYALGDTVNPTTYNTLSYVCIVAGSSAAGEPAWPTTIGTPIVDGGATWLCTAYDSFQFAEVGEVAR